jgi:hypothetical protein
MDNIEIHIKEYGITKSKDPAKNGKSIGLQTRLIIHPPVGALKILNFDYQFEASRYIKETYGDVYNVGKTYNILSNYKLYGNKGYRWK